MVGLVESRTLSLAADGKPVTDPAQVRQMLEAAIGEALKKLGEYGFLVS